ncbi:DUF5998 family protein [Schaalia sp. 19OD2882]|uniref:DUF5998 family protein n=1 Tax=Schaalia sp. 19OD2882 TaxID=2794089 RepID=UPI0020A7393A|nr:DUF5998 family protein [Schaalia sp. 19OD2882]
MSPWHDIERIGFYPQVVQRTLRRVLGGVEPEVVLHQLDAGFDRGSMFRHLTLIAVSRPAPEAPHGRSGRVLVHLHVDELEDGGASVATAIHPLTKLKGLALSEVVPSPVDGSAAEEVTVSLDLGGVRRTDLEPAHCDDPECAADHGYTGTTVPDDLVIRVSATADGEDSLARAHALVDLLCAELTGNPRA